MQPADAPCQCTLPMHPSTSATQYGLPTPRKRSPLPRVITFQRKRANRRVVNEAALLKMLGEFGEVRRVGVGGLGDQEGGRASSQPAACRAGCALLANLWAAWLRLRHSWSACGWLSWLGNLKKAAAHRHSPASVPPSSRPLLPYPQVRVVEFNASTPFKTQLETMASTSVLVRACSR